jgi:hypothetical protein
VLERREREARDRQLVERALLSAGGHQRGYERQDVGGADPEQAAIT